MRLWGGGPETLPPGLGVPWGLKNAPPATLFGTLELKKDTPYKVFWPQRPRRAIAGPPGTPKNATPTTFSDPGLHPETYAPYNIFGPRHPKNATPTAFSSPGG